MTDNLRLSNVATNALQHTLGHVDCEACRETSRAAMASTYLASLPFTQAANLWLDSRRNIHKNTRVNYQSFINCLDVFFGKLILKEIEIGHIHTYQTQRLGGHIPGYGKAQNYCVNREIGTLQQIMVRAGEWARIKDWYEPLARVYSRRGRALSAGDKIHLFHVLSSRDRWMVAHCCALLTVNTTAGGGEIKHLQLQDLGSDLRSIYIRDGVKNTYRVRKLPLNDDAFWALSKLWARVINLGASLPHHYLIPKRVKGGFDLNSHAGDWRGAWESGCAAAGFKGLRYYDLRHTAITDLLENPHIPERAVIDLAGHVSNHMLDTYSHTRQHSLHDAVARIDTGLTKKARPHVVEISQAPSKPAVSDSSTCFYGSTLKLN